MTWSLRALLSIAIASTACTGETSSGPGADGAVADGAVRDAGAAADGATELDAAGTDGGALAAPTGLDAYGARAAVGLDWDEVVGADGYNVYWSTEPGPTPATGALLEGVAPGYVHRGLEDGTTYHYVVTAVFGGSEGPPSSPASATPGGDFVLHTLGSGHVVDVATDDPVDLPMERRMHLVVLPEGYLASDLATFETDVDDWYDEVFSFEPYALLREAIVVWYLPRASAERVAPGNPQPADTAFRVPITSDGRGVDSDVPDDGPTATRVWGEIASFPYAPTDFYPPGGRTSRLAKGVVAHILVYDAVRERSGLSGRARRLTDPGDATHDLSVAIAHGRAHELSHAIGRVGDEYLDVAITGLGVPNDSTGTSSGVHNVVEDNTCDTLPWRHLLAGGDINPDVEGLVGAFGTSEIGYHPEFKCQMNGSHDNGMFYGGDDNLRVDRFCNFCRELMVFRLLEHTRTLADTATSWATWIADHRTPFYDRHGLAVPAVVPQENSLGEARYEACAP